VQVYGKLSLRNERKILAVDLVNAR